jgi:hypothetical protein
VRVLEPGGNPDLEQEALCADGSSQLLAQDFHRDRPRVPDVPGAVDNGHAPGAKLALDPVSVSQRHHKTVLHGHASPGSNEEGKPWVDEGYLTAVGAATERSLRNDGASGCRTRRSNCYVSGSGPAR